MYTLVPLTPITVPKQSVTGRAKLTTSVRRSTTIHVLVLDSHPVVRSGIDALIQESDGVTLATETLSVAAAHDQLRRRQPDVVVLETELPDGSGIDFCRALRSSAPDVRCLFFTSDTDYQARPAAMDAGAAGFLLKDARGTSLISAIRLIAAGHNLPSVTADRASRPPRISKVHDLLLASLTHRERDILTLIAQGLSNREISQRLSLAENTVKNYVSRLFVKLGMHRRTQAAIFGADLLQVRGTLHDSLCGPTQTSH